MKKTEKKTAQAEEFQPEGVLKLRKPLMLDGKSVRELRYDFGALTAQDLIDADKDRADENDNMVYLQTIDTTSLLCLFARAVAHKMENCALSDIKRLYALDGQAAVVLARRFFTQGQDAEDTEEETFSTEL
ncbi:MAG: hypothetical protein FWE98_08570 [Oscillospiraceae bacterium]|nr:hypothetical protein [Oscillospiraceae bacterium]